MVGLLKALTLPEGAVAAVAGDPGVVIGWFLDGTYSNKLRLDVCSRTARCRHVYIV